MVCCDLLRSCADDFSLGLSRLLCRRGVQTAPTWLAPEAGTGHELSGISNDEVLLFSEETWAAGEEAADPHRGMDARREDMQGLWEHPHGRLGWPTATPTGRTDTMSELRPATADLTKHPRGRELPSDRMGMWLPTAVQGGPRHASHQLLDSVPWTPWTTW